MSKLHIKIVTPQKKYYEDDAYFISVPGKNGSLGFLPGHMPYFAILKEGKIAISDSVNTSDSNCVEFKIYGGYAHILDNSVLVLAEKITSNN